MFLVYTRQKPKLDCFELAASQRRREEEPSQVWVAECSTMLKDMGIESNKVEVALQRYDMGRKCSLKGQNRKAKGIRSRVQEKQEQTPMILTQRVVVEHGEIT